MVRIGIGDVRRLEARRGDLVEQRQERVEVMPVDDGDPHGLVGEVFYDRDAGKTCADDNHVRQGLIIG